MSVRVRPIQLNLIWHLHQPDYAPGSDGAPMLPWTRLHALRNYADLFDALRRHRDIRCTLDIDTGLLDRFSAWEDGTAPDDPFLRIARRHPGELSIEERRFVVSAFLDFRRDVLARDLPRLHELAARRGEHGAEGVPISVVERFDEQDLLDLQVLFHLAWCGRLLRDDGRVRAWIELGRGFSGQDKDALLEMQSSFLAGVAAELRALVASGNVEVATGPRSHPVVPLVCDLEAAHESDPNLKLPTRELIGAADVRVQLEIARESVRAFFGLEPDGGWAPEGAVSEETLQLFRDASFRWTASDETVLFRALGERRGLAGARYGRQLYRPWRYEDGPTILFRDSELSTAIAQDYGAWSPTLAAADLVHRLQRIRRDLEDDAEQATVTIAVDGENAWDAYPGGCSPFLDALFTQLTESTSEIRTVHAGEAAESGSPAALARVPAGSWEESGFATWIGRSAVNRAWDLLAETRDAVVAARGEPKAGDPAWQAVFAAEGSDWYRWLAAPVPPKFMADLESCFRGHLIRAWMESGAEPPQTLNDPIRESREDPSHAPAGPVRPTIDGRVEDWFEWLAAGRIDCADGVIAAALTPVRSLRFGGDGRHLYLRMDPTEPGVEAGLAGAIVRLVFPGWPEQSVTAVVPTSGASETGAVRIAADRVVELAVAVDTLPGDGDVYRFHVEVETAAGARQRIPDAGALSLPAGEDQERPWDWHV